jgi:ferredoxin-NADP reductase
MKRVDNWAEALIEAIRDITPTVREFTLRPPGGAVAWEPGAHVRVQVLVNDRPQTRHYSLVGQPDSAVYRIAVKRLDDGKGGSLAMWRLAVGDRLPVTNPNNSFPLSLAAPSYLIVGGGIGVTPLIWMAQVLRQRGAAVRMLFGARSEQELAYGALLRETLGDALHTAALDRGEQVDLAGAIAALPDGAQMYLCGPGPMLDAARRAWAAAGRKQSDLRYETFGSSGRLAPQAFRLRMPRHDLDIDVASDCSLLDAIEAAGVKVMSGCRRGECGLCALDVIAVDGEVDHRDCYLTDEEKMRNRRICACVSRVAGAITLDSAFRPDWMMT